MINGNNIDLWLQQAVSFHGYKTSFRQGDTDALSAIFSNERNVDITDFSILMIDFNPTEKNTAVNTWHKGNFDGNDDIYIIDFDSLVQNFSTMGYRSTAAMRKPSCGVLLAFAFSSIVAIEIRQRSDM